MQTAGFLTIIGIAAGLLVVCVILLRLLLVKFWNGYEEFTRERTDWADGTASPPAEPRAPAAEPPPSVLVRFLRKLAGAPPRPKVRHS